MFGKLMRAEWRSSRRVVGALCVVVLISGLLLGALGNGMVRAAMGDWNIPDFVGILFVLLVIMAVLAVGLALGASVFYAVWRYYRSRFTEEGYLTFTLPVNGHQLMLSSILASVLEILLVALATLGAVMLAFGIFSVGLPWNVVHVSSWQTFWEGIGEILDSLNPLTGDLLWLLLSALLMGLTLLMEIMLAVTIGATVAKKHPILLSVAAFYAISFVRSLVNIGAAMQLEALSSRTTFGILDISNALTVVIAYFAMYYLTSRKLNLN